MAEWIKVGGTWSKSGDAYRISGENKNGSFEIDGSEFKEEDGAGYVKEGATARNTQFPTTIDVSQREAHLTGRDTYCIGLVLFRCSDHKAIGVCVGAWDCGG